MIPDAPTLTIPLRTEPGGAIRVSGTRVTLDTLIGFYLQGESPEDLHAGFPTVPLTDIYAVIAYYLANREEVDAYVQRRAEAAETLRREIEANRTPEQRSFDERLRKLAEERRRAKSELRAVLGGFRH